MPGGGWGPPPATGTPAAGGSCTRCSHPAGVGGSCGGVGGSYAGGGGSCAGVGGS